MAIRLIIKLEDVDKLGPQLQRPPLPPPVCKEEELIYFGSESPQGDMSVIEI